MHALRSTAIRMRLDTGIDLDDPADLQEMHAFMGSRERTSNTRYRLKRLPPLPEDGESPPEVGPQTVADLSLPSHKPRHFQPGEGFTHGFYAHSQPPQDLAEMLRQDIRGIDAEFTCRHYTTASRDEFIDMACSHDLVHYHNSDWRYGDALDRLRTPVLVTVRSHRSPSAFTQHVVPLLNGPGRRTC